jgi:hypothetical protein
MMRRPRFLEQLLVCTLVVTATSCGRDEKEDQLVEEYKQFVEDRSACTQTSECSLAGGGCPLGCGAGVRSEHADAVNVKAMELISVHEARGQACKYKCPAQHAECVAGRCTAVPDR